MDTITNTVKVAVPVSRRDAHEMRDNSWRTCLTNCAGDTLAIDSYQYKFNFCFVLTLNNSWLSLTKSVHEQIEKVV